jgi:hypothetical protein
MATILIGLSLILVGSTATAAPAPQTTARAGGDVQLAGVVTSAITYQGRLTTAAGDPLTGAHTMLFQIWDDASTGSQIGGDIPKPGVQVNQGLFTVKLDLEPGWLFYVDGRGLWLRVQVDGQWLTPRQELLPTPYALTLRPGAIISSPGPDSLHVWNQAGGFAVEAWSQNNIGLLGSSGGPREIPPSGLHGVHGVGDGVGVYGEGGHTGVYGNGEMDGVKGESTANNGVRGLSGSGNGVAGESTTGYGVVGWTGTETSGDISGVYGHSTEGIGVRGRSINYHGVVGWTGTQTHGEISGVYGHSSEGTGVTGRSVNYNGIKAITQSDEHAALAAGNEGSGPAIYAQGGTLGISAVFRGNVRVQSLGSGATILELGEGLDVAEGFDVAASADIQPGAVLVIDSEQPGQLTLSQTAYDHKVAGIVAGAAGLSSGLRLGVDQHEVEVALAGRVYCNVDATYGAVEPGDLLTTSPTPGFAMTVIDHTLAQGAVLGKAMEPLAKGQRAQILVLVTLQ